MRKVKLQMQMTINGYVGGPNGENDWMTWNPDDEFLQFISSHFDSLDTLLLGRKLADGFIEHWENVAGSNPEHPFAKKIVETPKIVEYIDHNISSMNRAAQQQALPFTAHKVKPTINNSFWVNLIGRGYPAPSKQFRW